MAYTTPTVNYCATYNGTYTSITGVQSISINRGRQRFQDNIPQTSCTIEIIPTATYTLPFAIGQFIDVRDANTSTSPAYFVGQITDVERKYAMPYNTSTGVAAADRILITASGAVGYVGNAALANYSFAAGFTDARISSVLGYVGCAYANVVGSIRNSAQTFTGGALDLINGLLRTSQYMIDDMDNQRIDNNRVASTYPAGYGNVNYTFSDAGTVGAYKFSDLQYLTSVQNTFGTVQVVPAGLATQTATGGSSPSTLVYDTYNESTADASNLANFIVSTQSTTTTTPYSITTNTLLSSGCTTMSLLTTYASFVTPSLFYNLGSSVTVIFRSTTATAQIQGINTTFYPEYASVQLFLSPSLGTAFILGSSAFGVLDTNRLGYP